LAAVGAAELAAGADGADAGAGFESAAGFDPAAGAVPESAELLEVSLEDVPSLLPEAAGLAEEYRSLYQPPPWKLKAAAVMVRSSRPPQCGHTVSSASLYFWIFSMRRWQVVHSYS